MKNENVKKLLVLGLLFAIVTATGEILGAFAPSTDTGAIGLKIALNWMENQMGTTSMHETLRNCFNCYENLRVWQIGLGACIGAFGILGQYLGYYGIYRTFDNKESRWAKAYFVGNIGYTLIGSLVHFVLCTAMYVYKLNANSTNCWDVLGEFALWFVAPIVGLFYIFYFIFSVAIFVQMWKGHTAFPKWCCLLNPLVGKAIFGAIAGALPSSPFANSFQNATMGLTAVIMLTVFIGCMKKEGENRTNAN